MSRGEQKKKKKKERKEEGRRQKKKKRKSRNKVYKREVSITKANVRLDRKDDATMLTWENPTFRDILVARVHASAAAHFLRSRTLQQRRAFDRHTFFAADGISSLSANFRALSCETRAAAARGKAASANCSAIHALTSDCFTRSSESLCAGLSKFMVAVVLYPLSGPFLSLDVSIFLHSDKQEFKLGTEVASRRPLCKFYLIALFITY
jgi:hypothetical protein